MQVSERLFELFEGKLLSYSSSCANYAIWLTLFLNTHSFSMNELISSQAIISCLLDGYTILPSGKHAFKDIIYLLFR